MVEVPVGKRANKAATVPKRSQNSHICSLPLSFLRNPQVIRQTLMELNLPPPIPPMCPGVHLIPGFGDADFFRSILENLHMAVYVIGRDGKILFWNDGAERITGYLRQDVIGHAFSDNFLGENDGSESNTSDAPSPIS
jgi:PAS domain-containing protein